MASSDETGSQSITTNLDVSHETGSQPAIANRTASNPDTLQKEPASTQNRKQEVPAKHKDAEPSIQSLQKEPSDKSALSKLLTINEACVGFNGKQGLSTQKIPLEKLRSQYIHAHDILSDYAKLKDRKIDDHAEKLAHIRDITLQICKEEEQPIKFAWPFDANHNDTIGGNSTLRADIDVAACKTVQSNKSSNQSIPNEADFSTDSDLDAAKKEIERILKCEVEDYEAIMGFEREGNETYTFALEYYRQLAKTVHPDTLHRAGENSPEWIEKAKQATQSKIFLGTSPTLTK